MFADLGPTAQDRPVQTQTPAAARSVGLALGGGGARGFTHIGVLQVLEAAGIRIAEIAGTSAGALYAAGYAFGFGPAELLDHARHAPRRQIFRPWPSGGALCGRSGLPHWLTGIFGSVNLEDGRIPLTIVATRARDGTAVLLRRGPLVPAVVASATIPLVFPPVEIDGDYLIDGGVSLPVPDPALSGARPVVAVDLGPGPIQSRGGWNPQLGRRAEAVARRVPGARLRAGILGSVHQNIAGYRGPRTPWVIRPAVGRWEDLAYLSPDRLIDRGRAAAESLLPALEAHLAEIAPAPTPTKNGAAGPA